LVAFAPASSTNPKKTRRRSLRDRIDSRRRNNGQYGGQQRRQTVRPDYSQQQQQQRVPTVEYEGEAGSTRADRCPLPALPINRDTYCSPSLKRCGNDEQCAGERFNRTVCCFNGCVFTCMVPMDAPKGEEDLLCYTVCRRR
jgi:hypothetical protein